VLRPGVAGAWPHRRHHGGAAGGDLRVGVLAAPWWCGWRCRATCCIHLRRPRPGSASWRELGVVGVAGGPHGREQATPTARLTLRLSAAMDAEVEPQTLAGACAGGCGRQWPLVLPGRRGWPTQLCSCRVQPARQCPLEKRSGGTMARAHDVAPCCSCESPRIQTAGCGLSTALITWPVM